MEKKNKIIIIVILVLIIAVIAASIAFKNNKQDETNITTNNVEMNIQENTTQTIESQNQVGPKDPIDENPSNVIATPTEEQVDQIMQSNPTI